MTRLLFALLLLVLSPSAFAATKAQAYDAAQAAKATFVWNCRVQYNFQSDPEIRNFTVTDEPVNKQFKARGDCYFAGSYWNFYMSFHAYDVACPAGSVYVRASDSCVNAQERCLNKNDAVSSPVTMAGVFGQCVDGCRIGSRTDQGGAGRVDVNSTSISFGAIGYTGETCTGNEPLPVLNDGQTCTNAGSLTMCIKPDGRHCASASTGRQICWQPGEVGTKTDGPVAQTRAPGTNPPTDPPPPPGESWDPSKKQGPVTSTTTTPNGTTINTSIINNFTNNGTNPGGDGGEAGDGSDDEGDGGTVGGGLGDLYEGEGKTVGDAYGAFKTRMQSAPVLAAAGEFFTVNVAGSCPVWTVPETAFTPVLTLDLHCSGEFATIMEYAGWVVLAIAAFAAFRIALY